MRSRYPRNHINEDYYPIKRVVVFFLFSPDAKIVEKSVKICYNRISCGADKTKSKEIEVVGIAAFAIAIVVILEIAGVPMPL